MYRNGVPSHDEAARDPENPNKEAGPLATKEVGSLFYEAKGIKYKGQERG